MKLCIKRIIFCITAIACCNVIAMQPYKDDELKILKAAEKGFSLEELIVVEALVGLSRSDCAILQQKPSVCNCGINQGRRFFHCALIHDYCVLCNDQFLDRQETRTHMQYAHKEQKNLIQLLQAKKRKITHHTKKDI